MNNFFFLTAFCSHALALQEQYSIINNASERVHALANSMSKQKEEDAFLHRNAVFSHQHLLDQSSLLFENTTDGPTLFVDQPQTKMFLAKVCPMAMTDSLFL